MLISLIELFFYLKSEKVQNETAKLEKQSDTNHVLKSKDTEINSLKTQLDACKESLNSRVLDLITSLNT